MPASSNPTKTRTIEANWKREINRRWRLFTKRAVAELERMNTVALGQQIINAADPFVMDPSQQRVYMAFLELQISNVLLGGTGPINWQAEYQLESYRRGLETTRAALLSQGPSLALSEAERLAAQGITTFSATANFGTAAGAISAPIHQAGLAFLTERSYTTLQGWTDQLAQQTRQVLFDGLVEGQGVDKVVRELVKRTDVSRARARVIAQTETNQAYSRSTISEAERAAEEIGEDVNLRWLTVRDTKVRHLHATWHGKVMTPQEASANKNVSPWNCRCGFAPVIPEADTPAKTAKFTKQRRELLAEEAKAA